MKDTGRQKFEDSWKEAFEGSEMNPSDSVWSNIDLKLDNEKMKRRVVYYQRLAAAAVLFALLIGVGGMRYLNNTTPESVALKPNSDKTKGSSTATINSQDKPIADNKLKGESNNSTSDRQSTETVLLSKSQSNEIDSKSSKSTTPLLNEQINSVNHSVRMTFASNVEIQKRYGSTFLDTQRYLPLASQSFENLSSYNSPPVLKSQLPDVAEEIKKENKIENAEIASALSPVDPSNEKTTEQKKKKTEDLWLAFGAAAGSYNPGNSGSSVQTMSSSLASANYGFVNQAAPQSTRSSAGAAYSIGLSLGKKIADRWIIQTGVNYLSQAINYTSNFTTQSAANESKAALADYAGLSQAATPVLTQPYKVNSNMEFVSIPVQAGYIIIDRKIGLQLNAGVASDIFLKNTLKDQSGQSNKYSQASGGESPYRSLNWAGLASTELSYKMSKQYRISLQPGFRYSLQPALKSQSGTNANPLVLDIGFRFRYIFQ